MAPVEGLACESLSVGADREHYVSPSRRCPEQLYGMGELVSRCFLHAGEGTDAMGSGF